MEERIPLTARVPTHRVYPNTTERERNGTIVDEGSLELLEHLIAIVLQGNTQYLETLLRNDEILEVLDLHDNKGFTALHIASERVDSESVRLLLEADANPNVMDRFRRTALHWVVSGGCHCDFCDTKRARCTEFLLRAKGNLEIKDVKGETPLSYAAKNSFHKAAGVMLDHGAEINQICNGVNTGQLIIQKIPEVITHLLDQSVAYDKDDNSKLKIDFKLFLQSPPSMEEKEEQKRTKANDNNEGTLRRRKYAIAKEEMNLFNSFLKTSPPIRETLLTHPVTQTFLHLKWIYVRKWLWFIRLFYSILTLTYTYFIFKLYIIRCPYNDNEKESFERSPRISRQIDDPDGDKGTVLPAVEDVEPEELESCKETLDVFILAICIASWVGVMLLTAIYDLAHSCKAYFLKPVNLGWWILISSITFSILPGFGILNEISKWQYIVAALAVFYAWAMNLSHLSQIPFFGAYVEMLTTVLQRLAIVMITYSSLFFAFTFGFCVLFPNTSYFKHIPSAFTHVILLMLGKTEYSANFNRADEPLLDNMGYWTVTHVYYIGFIIVFGIVMLNVLVALAVSDIQLLQRNAELARVSRQIVGMSMLESMVSDNWISNCIQKYILSQISVNRRNGSYFRFSPIDPEDKSLPSEIKMKFFPLLHTRDCLIKKEILQRPVRPTGQLSSQNHHGFHRGDPARGSNHSYQSQRKYTGTSTDNIDEILNELKVRLEGLQRRRTVSHPVFC